MKLQFCRNLALIFSFTARHTLHRHPPRSLCPSEPLQASEHHPWDSIESYSSSMAAETWTLSLAEAGVQLQSSKRTRVKVGALQLHQAPRASRDSGLHLQVGVRRIYPPPLNADPAVQVRDQTQKQIEQELPEIRRSPWGCQSL